MRNRPFLIRMVSVLAVGSLGFTFSCSTDESRFSQEAAYAVEESSIDAYYTDADDMAGVAVSESDETEGGKISSGARTLEINDDRFCEVTVVLDPDLSQFPNRPVGDIVINFGESCEDPYGNIRRGKINVHFEGRKFRPGSFISIAFENYHINDIKLSGTRTLTNLGSSTVGEPRFQVELVDGLIEWDGNIATRENCFTGTWVRGNIFTASDDVLKISQCADADEAAKGVNRKGVDYRVFIDKPLVYKRGCPTAVSGTKTFVEVNTGKEIIIDYGSGTCDAEITLTVNGNIHSVRSR